MESEDQLAQREEPYVLQRLREVGLDLRSLEVQAPFLHGASPRQLICRPRDTPGAGCTGPEYQA